MKDYSKHKEVNYDIVDGQSVSTCPYGMKAFVGTESCFACRYNKGSGGYLAYHRNYKTQSVVCNHKQHSSQV